MELGRFMDVCNIVIFASPKEIDIVPQMEDFKGGISLLDPEQFRMDLSINQAPDLFSKGRYLVRIQGVPSYRK